MNSFLDFREGHLCILNEIKPNLKRRGVSPGALREWYAVREATQAEVATLIGRPLRRVESNEGLYVDEDGEVYQVDRERSGKPLAVEHLRGAEKTELEALLAASLKGGQTNGKNDGAKRLLKRTRWNGRKLVPSPTENGNSKTAEQTIAAVETPDWSFNSQPCGDSVRLNLHQKLAEVRRRIGYVQKRGHNERNNYSYVTAADIAGAVGDLLSELGVVVVPTLESITYEPVRTTNGQVERVAHVVMIYKFTDVDTGESVMVKVPGEGLDSGDKAPYKAMTGALKYALLQSFLLATGDDPEDERADARLKTERSITADETRVLKTLIDDTGTDLERVLAYYKLASLEEMTESTYLRAVELLNRKLSKRGNQENQETVHAAD